MKSIIMKTALRIFVWALLLVASPALAADIGSIVNNAPLRDNFKIIGVADLAKLMADPSSHVHIYDADPPGVRESEGMIVGARPLTSDDHYDVAEELPSNRNAKLVFYCHNRH